MPIHAIEEDLSAHAAVTTSVHGIADTSTLYRAGGTDVAISDGGTGQGTALGAFNALSPLTAAGDLLYRSGTDNVRLPVGTAKQILRVNAGANAPEWVDPELVYVPTTADKAVNVVADTVIATKDVTGIVAGNQIIVEGSFTILNNSGATRVYVITLDFDARFDIEISTGALAASATLVHVFRFRAVLDVRSVSLAYMTIDVMGQLAAGLASGGDTVMTATCLRGMGWGTTASDVTGTTTVALSVRSANAAATQTLRLHQFSIRKHTPT